MRSTGLGTATLGGGRGLLIALAGGMAAALAHPPFGVMPGLFGFAAIQIALEGASEAKPLRSAFLRGWVAGAGYLLIGTWWVAEAFFVDAAAHGWQAPLAVLGLAGGIGLFWGGAGVIYRVIAPDGATRPFAFAAVLSLFEWLRGHVLTGFPWDLPGEAWRAGSAVSQGAALLGAYGMTFVTVALGAAPSVLWRGRRGGRIGAGRAAVVMALAAAGLTALWGYGALRLARRPPPELALRVRIVQPGLSEQPVWTAALVRQRVERFMRLSALPARHPPDVVIWPEGAIPAAFNDYLQPGSWIQAAMLQAFRPGQLLMDGGYRFAGPPAAPQAFNTLLMLRRIEGSFRVEGLYDKYRLVPFGEFLPFPGAFSALGLSSLVQNGEPFAAGPRPAPITVTGVPRFQPLICYESLFPGLTTDRGGRAAWIVNVSDDAWFGHTTGPLQHLNLASYRAIEEGLPLLRATPTGVSAVVDANGRVQARLGLSRQGVIDARLPARLSPPPYTRWRELPFCLMILLSLVVARFDRRGAGLIRGRSALGRQP